MLFYRVFHLCKGECRFCLHNAIAKKDSLKKKKHKADLAGCKIRGETLVAYRAEHLLLTVKFIESIGFEHDTFLVLAVTKTE